MRKGINFFYTHISTKAKKSVLQLLETTYISAGKIAEEFEIELSKQLGLVNPVTLNSGTSALHLALIVAEVGPGNEVILPAQTFVASGLSILMTGAIPVFADIQYDTLNIDPDSIEKRINKKTRAIMIVHYGGVPCELDQIRELGKTYHLPIIEDSAHALGSKYKGKYIGAEGDYITFSMQVVKIINTGDGGLITTTSEKSYELLKKLVWYGVDRETKITELIDPLPNNIDILGFKANMNDITATLGILGVENFDTPLKRRKYIGELYRREFKNLRKLELLKYANYITPNYQIFPVHIKDREKFALFMRDKKIMVNVNNRRNDRYSIFGGFRDELYELNRADMDTILIPLHADLTDNDLDRIISAIREYDRI